MSAITVKAAAVYCFIAMGLAASPLSRALDDLLEDCRAVEASPESTAAIRCVHYIRGFLDAARGWEHGDTDAVVRLPFGSRVARVPDGRSAPYCIEADIAPEEIIDILVSASQPEAKQPTPPAAKVLERLLRAHYRCGNR